MCGLQHHQNLPGCGAISPGQESGCMCGGTISSMTGLVIFPSHCTTRWVWKAFLNVPLYPQTIFYFISSWIKTNAYHPCFLFSQVMFRKTGYIYGKVYITGWHFMDFPMPQVGDYELMVRGRYEGGDGPVRKIRIQGKSKGKAMADSGFLSSESISHTLFLFSQVKHL